MTASSSITIYSTVTAFGTVTTLVTVIYPSIIIANVTVINRFRYRKCLRYRVCPQNRNLLDGIVTVFDTITVSGIGNSLRHLPFATSEVTSGTGSTSTIGSAYNVERQKYLWHRKDYCTASTCWKFTLATKNKHTIILC